MLKKTPISAFAGAAALLASAAPVAAPTFVNGLALDGGLIDALTGVGAGLIKVALATSLTFITTGNVTNGGACPTVGQAAALFPTGTRVQRFTLEI